MTKESTFSKVKCKEVIQHIYLRFWFSFPVYHSSLASLPQLLSYNTGFHWMRQINILRPFFFYICKLCISFRVTRVIWFCIRFLLLMLISMYLKPNICKDFMNILYYDTLAAKVHFIHFGRMKRKQICFHSKSMSVI